MSAAKKTFVTGFGPFLKVTDNPSSKLAETSGRPYQILEVSFDGVEAFLGELDPRSFDRLVLIGVATGRKQMTPELFARNQIGKVKDVRGNDRFGAIDASAPLLVEGTLWDPELLIELLPHPNLMYSYDAGSYLCNYTFFRALQRFPEKKVGFLHIPYPDDLPLERQEEMLQAILQRVEGT